MHYHKHKQYNENKLHRVLYPTRDALEVRSEPLSHTDQPNAKIIQANGNRRRPLDLQLLSYEEQKEFFKLDEQYDQAFVTQHELKVSTKNRH